MSKFFGIGEALSSLCPDALWEYYDEDYSTLVWNSPEIKQPTKKQVNDEISRLISQWEQAEIEAEEQKLVEDMARESALKKLAKLGLTEDEVRMIVRA